jgi:hypothetical protein
VEAPVLATLTALIAPFRRRPAMQLFLWSLVLAAGAIGVAATIGGMRFERRVDREVRELWSASGLASPRALDRAELERLPAPVRAYLTRAIARPTVVRTVRLRHGGTFRTTLDGAWLPIRGEQYFATDPPGFIWWGRVRMAPGLWVDARDRSVDGTGGMLVALESLVRLADGSGDALDQGALLRLLGEMPWFPTAFLDGRHVGWDAIDERRARARLRVGGREVAGTFEFGGDGLPRAFTAERYRDTGGGTAVLTSFIGETSDFREVGGLLVPHLVIGGWIVNGERKDYVRFSIERIEFDAASPY